MPEGFGEEVFNLRHFDKLIGEVCSEIAKFLSDLERKYEGDEEKRYCLDVLTSAIDNGLKRASQFDWDAEHETFNTEFREGLVEDIGWYKELE